MGVSRLWEILLTVAANRQVDDLSGLVLAIDASIWIVKVNSIFDSDIERIKCIFNKILWFRRNNIKPIFVFDGQAPALKRKTLQDRRKRRRQYSDVEIKKKVEIEVLKKITDKTGAAKENQKNYQQKKKEIDLMLAQLLSSEESYKTIELSEKLSMQGEVLNKKYELYFEMIPLIIQKYGDALYFSELDIESKEEILERIQREDLPSNKQLRAIKGSMSEEQKILYDMQIIKKKSQIRQIQDNLYRRLFTKKVENGYEVIESVYNGKKVVQKRKMKEKRNFDDWAFTGKGKKNKLNNDFRQIFENKRNEKKNEGEVGEQELGYFGHIFGKQYNQPEEQSLKTNKLRDFSQRLSEQRQSEKLNKFLEEDQEDNQNHEMEANEFYQNFEHFQQKNQIDGKNRSFMEEVDNFPDFIMMQELDSICSSNDNIQLQSILEIMGVNFIVAPAEAESQCATLQKMGVVDGVVTEDSDVFLFGARRVYRGVFQDNIKFYSMQLIQKKLNLNQEKLIIFGMMLGSDYTDGIKGIGIVNAMQILKVHETIEDLCEFTKWAKTADIFQENEENTTDNILKISDLSENQKQFYRLHRKFKNYWHVHPDFPQRHIYQAYKNPEVHENKAIQKKCLQNKKVQMPALLTLMQDKFGMPEAQVQHNLKIIHRDFERVKQTSLDEFLQTGVYAKIKSKRLQKAIDIN